MHRISSFVFWGTLLLFSAVLIFASYVGVYLQYVAIPVIIVSGVVMRLTRPKAGKAQGPFAKFLAEAKKFFKEEATEGRAFLKEEADFLENSRKAGEAAKINNKQIREKL
uniref:hypothetical protein n=1 Tax=Pseudomonas sp. TaxID=306 RepID=UPI0011646162|nr:hypothetical protein [Pseudomonas sp.]QDK64812.1 hypothetical protein pA6H2_p05 [Pseudomonas sp.]